MTGRKLKMEISLDKKKIIFIGNSFTYYGKCVLRKDYSQLSLSERINDHGYFYELCRENGMDVSVTNWTFGAHALRDSMGHCCGAKRACSGADHLSYLTDRFYDYVVFQEGSGGGDDFMEICEKIIRLFKSENPNTKFVALSHTSNVFRNRTPILKNLYELEKRGVTVVDWGTLVCDIISGAAAVPGAGQTYTKNEFIVCQSEADGYHPNPLTGYITALMTFSALTGKSAVGQPYAFCGDTSVNGKYDFGAFINAHYTYNGAVTKFPEIFKSESDMQGIQMLVDRYIANKPYRKYAEI